MYHIKNDTDIKKLTIGTIVRKTFTADIQLKIGYRHQNITNRYHTKIILITADRYSI